MSDKKIEKIGAMDVLLMEINNSEKVNTKTKMDWAKKWGANYVVPIGYEEGNSEFGEFLDAVDREDAQKVDSLKIDKLEDLPEGMEVVILEQQ